MTDEVPAGKTRRKAAHAEQWDILRITLNGLQPEVWRQVRVPADLTLGGLHWVIQFSMGWTNSHLHMFHVQDIPVSDLRFEIEEEDLRDENTITVREAMPRLRSSMRYEYDFGDSWEHTVKREESVAPVTGEPAILCLDGAQACPPEDCGGTWGYVDMLASLADPDDPEHETYIEWTGGHFDPNAFDIKAVNRALKRLRLMPRQLIDVKPPAEWDW